MFNTFHGIILGAGFRLWLKAVLVNSSVDIDGFSGLIAGLTLHDVAFKLPYRRFSVPKLCLDTFNVGNIYKYDRQWLRLQQHLVIR